jgi:hypothetical protein
MTGAALTPGDVGPAFLDREATASVTRAKRFGESGSGVVFIDARA